MPVPIVYQNFVPPAIDAGNLNTVNNVVYTVIGDGTNAPLNAANVRTNIGLGNVDNTSDANKPLSTATTAALLAQNPGRLLNVQTFTANGTYTPTAGTTRIVVELCGGGGAGGGTSATTAGQLSAGGGGGGGAYAKSFFTSGFSGVTVTVGLGGTGVNGGTGNAGGSSSFGALVVAPGGSGAAGGAASATGTITATGSGGNGGLTPTGSFFVGNVGLIGGAGLNMSGAPITGRGAASPFGGGGTSEIFSTSTGLAGNGYGGGGGGAAASPSAATQTGGAGQNGRVVIYEYS